MGQQYGWLEYKTKCTGKKTAAKDNFIGSNFLDPIYSIIVNPFNMT